MRDWAVRFAYAFQRVRRLSRRQRIPIVRVVVVEQPPDPDPLIDATTSPLPRRYFEPAAEEMPR